MAFLRSYKRLDGRQLTARTSYRIDTDVVVRTLADFAPSASSFPKFIRNPEQRDDVATKANVVQLEQGIGIQDQIPHRSPFSAEAEIVDR